jgi:Ni2+-binding GTPase involved in maturation of urease and hydrogenase
MGNGRIGFTMIGGFLGAGKTTTIRRLAQHYQAQGKRIGIVTNDQAFGLVDTENLRHAGFSVQEVPGACFCCKFDDLISTTEKLSTGELPDIILAEPVGSCTDLAATVVEPMRRLYGDRFTLGPLVVLLKPEHGRKVLSGETGLGFSPKAAYIFLKQLEEADVIVINKVDKLNPREVESLTAEIKERFPGKKVLCHSATSGSGFDALVQAMDAPAPLREEFMEVDYDIYAEGEAELGWLNCQVDFKSASALSLDEVVLALVRALAGSLANDSVEPAHLKVMAQAGSEASIANLVASDSAAELSLESDVRTSSAELLINARVAVDPERLEEIVREVIAQQSRSWGFEYEIRGMQRFRPGRPMPTHRIAAAS